MVSTGPAEVLDPAGYQALADLMHEGGAIEEPLDASQFVDRTCLDRAAEMGCGSGETSRS